MPTRAHSQKQKPLPLHFGTGGMPWLACITMLLLAPASPVNAQGGWQQTEFVIGPWEDPLTPAAGSNDLHYFQQAKDAYFNLLTGTVFHSFEGHFTSPTFYALHHYAKLDAANQVGLPVLLAHPQTTGVPGEIAPAFNPAFPPQIFAMYDQIGSNALTNGQNDALRGYFLWDEPKWVASNIDFIKSWIEAIRADDIARNDGHYRMTYLNLFPHCDDLPCDGSAYASLVSSIVNDANPNRRLDVVSTDLYPFSKTPVNPTYSKFYWARMRDLRAVMGARPFWIVSLVSPSAGGNWASDPDDNQLRFQAYCPVAAGAKGILWFNYRHIDITTTPADYPILAGDMLTCKYFKLQTINHHLHDVIGPVVMSTNHLGVFHQDNVPEMDATSELTLVSAAPAASCPPTNLGNSNFVVGVFQPSGSPNEYYLLVVNKSLTAQSGTVSLRASYSIAAAPSVVGYVGGTSYTSLPTGTSFPVSLAGGEGRLYRLTPSPISTLALTAPSGGETWRAGESHTITWSPSSATVDISLVADALANSPDGLGPTTVLATGQTGGSYTFTVPAVWSRAARISISDGTRVQSHNIPIITAPVEPPGTTSYSFTGGQCAMPGATLALDVAGNPTVAYAGFPLSMRVERFDGNAWWPASPYLLSWGSGMSLSGAYDSSNRLHTSHLTNVWNAYREVTHTYQNASGGWVSELVYSPADAKSNCAMTISANGDVLIAFADKLTDQISVLHKVGSEWVSFGPVPGSNKPHDISIVTDASNNAYVSFIDGDPAIIERLVVAKLTGSAATTLLGATGQFGTVSLALDQNGKPAVAYTVELGDELRYLRYRAYNGTSWNAIQTVDGTLQTISACALAFEGTSPRVAYVGNRLAKYAMYIGSAWERMTVYNSCEAEGPVSLRFASGVRWISFFDRSNDRMRLIGPDPGGGEPPCYGCEPGEILRAIRMVTSNPMKLGQELHFAFQLARRTSLEMGLYDIAGRRVARFAPQSLSAGSQQVRWNPGVVRPGAYFIRVMENGAVSLNKTLIYLN